MSNENISVSMIRATLNGLPHFAVPAPYTLRWYELGDEQAWVAIHVAADAYHTFTMATFEQEFGADVIGDDADVTCAPDSAGGIPDGAGPDDGDGDLDTDD